MDAVAATQERAVDIKEIRTLPVPAKAVTHEDTSFRRGGREGRRMRRCGRHSEIRLLSRVKHAAAMSQRPGGDASAPPVLPEIQDVRCGADA